MRLRLYLIGSIAFARLGPNATTTAFQVPPFLNDNAIRDNNVIISSSSSISHGMATNNNVVTTTEDCGCGDGDYDAIPTTSVTYSGSPSNKAKSIDLWKTLKTSDSTLYTLSGAATSLSQLLSQDINDQPKVTVVVFLRSFG